MTDEPDEHRQLREAIAEVRGLAAATLAQAKETNGRVTRLEETVADADKQLLRVRRTLWGSEADGIHSDGGLVGWMRTTRRDIRLLGAAVVLVMPLLYRLLDYWLG